MDIKEIRELAKIMVDTELTTLEISGEGTSVRLERNSALAAALAAHSPSAASIGIIGGADGPVATYVTEQETLKNEPQNVQEGTDVLSPTVGVFYAAPSPDSEPYVKVGSKVKKGDVLCIIEAMKLMNEITAEMDGTVAQVYIGNGQVVEYDQPLFRIV